MTLLLSSLSSMPTKSQSQTRNNSVSKCIPVSPSKTKSLLGIRLPQHTLDSSPDCLSHSHLAHPVPPSPSAYPAPHPNPKPSQETLHRPTTYLPTPENTLMDYQPT